jgi:NADH-quinone oxidoreductase subunit E
VPVPGPQNGRYAAEPLRGLTALTAHESGRTRYNASVQRAVDLGDTVARIDGTETPLVTPWQAETASPARAPARSRAKAPGTGPKSARPAKAAPVSAPVSAASEAAPATLKAPRKGKADDLKRIVGVGPKLEALLHSLGFWHFDQIADWTPAHVAWVDSRLGTFRGRILRDDWIGQARHLAGR